MPRKRKQIEQALSAKGFKLTETHHRYYKFYDGEKFTGIYTYISTGTKYKDYSDALLTKIAKQLKLSRREVCDLIDCPMSEEDYRKKLQDKGCL